MYYFYIFLLHCFMKNLETDKLKTLLEIIGNNPSVQVAHFSSGGTQLISALDAYCSSRGYWYQINITSEPFYKEMKEKFKNTSTTMVNHFHLKRRSYMIQAKQYDYLFVSIDIEETFQDDFFKRAYKTIMNAGNILMFIPKGDIKKRYSLIASLEENYFVASSVIDDLFENYDVVISKKMHGWGG